MGDYVAVIMAKVFILALFAIGMISLVNDLITGRLPL